MELKFQALLKLSFLTRFFHELMILPFCIVRATFRQAGYAFFKITHVQVELEKVLSNIFFSMHKNKHVPIILSFFGLATL